MIHPPPGPPRAPAAPREHPLITYAYKSAQGSGTVTAASPGEARARLRAEGVTVRAIRPAAPARAAGSSDADATRGRVAGYLARRQKLSTTRFARELATLLAVGTPVVESLELMGRQREGPSKVVLGTLTERLRSGAPLAEAMRDPRARTAFDDLSIALVEVGERAGNLETVLERLADFRERREEVRTGVGSALMYPMIVLGLAVLVTIFLMTTIVPNIIGPLAEAGRELPLLTVAVKAVSDFLIAWGIPLGIAAAAGVFVGVRWLRGEAGRAWWSRRQLRMPLLGEVARKQAVVHVCVVLSTLLRSGIDFGQACRLTARNTPQRVMRGALEAAYEAVASGADVARAVGETGEFPPLVVRAFGVGQRSGQMEMTLERVAAAYERDVKRDMDRIVKLLEPAMILVVAGLVLIIVFATFLPILEMSDAV